jgi:TonB family protein
MSLRILLVACLLGLHHPVCYAQDIQTHAEALMWHGRRLSDIRSSNAPAFRLKAAFSFVGDNLETVQGTYTEVWVSDSQWRREIVVNDLRHIDVGGPAKHWVLYPDNFPAPAGRLPEVMELFPPASLKLDFASISENSTGDLVAECALTQPILQNLKLAFCFDTMSGVLLQKVVPEVRPRNVTSFSCEYGTFRKFGDHWFPREVICFEDRHKAISANIVELSAAPAPDPALFALPEGAIELGRCSGKTIPPETSGRQLIFLPQDWNRIAFLHVWIVVDKNGKLKTVKLLRSASKDYEKSAQNAIRSWHFKPGTCDGEPMPMPMTIEVPATPR